MKLSQTRDCLALAVLLAAVLGFAPDRARASSFPLADLSGFSGTETVIDFEGLGLAEGDPVPDVGGIVHFQLADGSAPSFWTDGTIHEFGPLGTSAINNFMGPVPPYPALTVLFPYPVHRVGFELRATPGDVVSVMLMASGAVVDELFFDSLGTLTFFFYGFESSVGFDSMVLESTGSDGIMSLDNLRFESLGGPVETDLPQTDDPGPVDDPSLLALSCDGFDVVAATRSRGEKSSDKASRKSSRKSSDKASRGHKHRRLTARLLDLDGFPATSTDLGTAPTAQLVFSPADGGDPIDMTEALQHSRRGRDDGHVFRSRGAAWRIKLKRKLTRAPGTYLVTMMSGDESDYWIDPTCVDWFEVR